MGWLLCLVALVLPHAACAQQYLLYNKFATPYAYFAEGDSITAGNQTGNVAYPQLFAADATNRARFFSVADNAVPSSTMAEVNARAAALDAQKPPSPYTGIVSLLIGPNDFVAGRTAAQFLSDVSAYLDARRAAGWKVAICPLLPDTGDAGFNAWRATVNPTILTWVPSHADAICNFAADPTMGPDNAPLNMTYYLSDGVHPTLAGQAILETIMAATLVGLAQ